MGLLLLQQVAAYAISWSYNLQSAFKEAGRMQKPIMVDFYTDWCGWCTKLDKETYRNQKVANLAEKFICVKIDGDKNRDLVKKYNVTGYPRIIFFDSSGKIIDEIGGYAGPETFEKIMTAVLKEVGASPLEHDKETSSGEVLETLQNKTSDFELTGIMYDPKRPSAVVNNTIVGIGDTVDDAKVLVIKRNRVTLLYRNREIVLRLNK